MSIAAGVARLLGGFGALGPIADAARRDLGLFRGASSEVLQLRRQVRGLLKPLKGIENDTDNDGNVLTMVEHDRTWVKFNERL